MKIGSRSNVQWIDKIAASELTELFNMNAPQFLALASRDAFIKLKSNLIPIHIQDALQYLKPEGYLEITLPVTGMADFLAKHLKNSVWNELPQAFPSILSINGWGGGSFPRPDFILVKDLLDTQYEILLDEKGQVELPQEGIGLFSMLCEITLMYSYEQIMQGRGFETLVEEGARPNELYLLPPPQSNTAFSMTLRVTHLEASNQPRVDFEQTYLFGFNPDRQQAQLTAFGARTLIKYLFSEIDFPRWLLSNKGSADLGIMYANGFNDFILSPEAIIKYYNLLIGAIIHQHVPCEFILSKVQNASFSMLAFKGIPFDQTDYRVIETLGSDALKELSNLSPRNPNSLKPFVLPPDKVTHRAREIPRRN